ncbi:MAG: hypothetical protein QM783_11135 [Phycisphaerales bacterium]
MHSATFVACATLISLLAGCASNQTQPVPVAAVDSAGVPAPDTSSVPSVVVDDAGVEPRRLLSFSGAPGWKGLMKCRDDASTKVTWQGTEPIDVFSATFTQTLEIEQDALDSQTIRYRSRQFGAPTVINVSGDPDNVRDVLAGSATPDHEWTTVTTTRFGDGFARTGVQPGKANRSKSGGTPIHGDDAAAVFLPNTPVGTGAAGTARKRAVGSRARLL